MTVRRYEPEDFEQIRRWAMDGYSASYEPHQFPKTGFIVDGLAAYFLYSTDSSVCFLENLISNKFASEPYRQRAIDLVTYAILAEAQKLGFKVAYATTSIPSVIRRAQSLGAHPEPNQTLLTKKLAHLQ
jgi:hypothetical protein